MLLVNGDLPREMPFTEKSSRNTFIIGAVHLLSITYKMCQIMCFYINTHLLSTEPFSFYDMVPPLMYIHYIVVQIENIVRIITSFVKFYIQMRFNDA